MNTTFSGTIREIAIGIYDGPHATPPESGDGPIFLGIENLTAEGRVDFSKVRHISEQRFPEWTRRVVPKPGDIVFSYEATLHRYGIIPEGFRGCLGRRLALIRPDTSKVDNQFLFYYLLSPKWRGVVESNIITGATVDRVPLKNFPNFPVQIPSLDTQKRIANVLSSYDSLIENNSRRIELLEQAARLLYKEWFVHFQFPGHERVNIVDGVPDGWERKRFCDLLETHIGGGWGQDEPTGAEIEPAFVIRGTDMASVTEGKFDSIGLRYHKENALKSRLLREGDIIFEVSGGSATQPVGRTLMISKTVIQQFEYGVIPASFCKLLRPTSVHVSCYLFFHLQYIRESGEMQVYQKQSASALQNFNFAAFIEHHSLPLPPENFLRGFAEQVTVIEEQKLNLARQNYNLLKARDLLLPRLMNGEIAI